MWETESKSDGALLLFSFTGKIPVGPLAFMEGSLIHTNEFMCSLGKDYFVWKSAKGVQ